MNTAGIPYNDDHFLDPLPFSSLSFRSRILLYTLERLVGKPTLSEWTRIQGWGCGGYLRVYVLLVQGLDSADCRERSIVARQTSAEWPMLDFKIHYTLFSSLLFALPRYGVYSSLSIIWPLFIMRNLADKQWLMICWRRSIFNSINPTDLTSFRHICTSFVTSTTYVTHVTFLHTGIHVCASV